jgi:hypothetical protein
LDRFDEKLFLPYGKIEATEWSPLKILLLSPVRRDPYLQNRKNFSSNPPKGLKEFSFDESAPPLTQSDSSPSRNTPGKTLFQKSREVRN